MKKIALILSMVGAMAVLSACSDEKSEIAEYKENFVNTCVTASGNPQGETANAISAICGCAYDKTIEKYGLKEFKRMDAELAKPKSGNSTEPVEPEFQKSMIEFVQQCTANSR